MLDLLEREDDQTDQARHEGELPAGVLGAVEDVSVAHAQKTDDRADADEQTPVGANERNRQHERDDRRDRPRERLVDAVVVGEVEATTDVEVRVVGEDEVHDELRVGTHELDLQHDCKQRAEEHDAVDDLGGHLCLLSAQCAEIVVWCVVWCNAQLDVV